MALIPKTKRGRMTLAVALAVTVPIWIVPIFIAVLAAAIYEELDQ